MIKTISESFKNTVQGEARTFRCKAIINGIEYTDIRESRLFRSCEADDSISLGSTVSSYIDMTIADVPKNTILNGQKLVYYIGLKTDSSLDTFHDEKVYEWIKIGEFNIDSSVFSDNDVQITAYDNFYLCEKGFFSSLKGMQKVKNIINEQCTKLGIEYIDDIEDVSYNIDVLKGLTIREAFGYLSSFLGKNAVFNEEGYLRFIWYTDIDYTIDGDRFNSPLDLGDIEYTISGLKCTVTAKSVDGNGIETDNEKTLEAGTDQFISFSNLYMTEDRLQVLLNRINGFKIRKCSVDWCMAEPIIQVGDIVSIKDTDDIVYSIPIMEMELNIDGGCYGTIVSKYISNENEESKFEGSISKKVEHIYTEFGSFQEVVANKVTAFNGSFIKVNTDILSVNKELTAVKGTIDSLDTKYAEIDLSNVGVEHVGHLFADIGLLTDVTVNNGNVTGILNGVKINGDLITANTLKVKDLLLEGEDGLIYQINALSSGLSQTELSKEIYQQKLNGTDIIANSITGKQIAGKTITAKEIDVDNLFAQNITATGTITGMTLKGGSININDKFKVDSAGRLYASEAEINGSVISQSSDESYKTIMQNSFIKSYSNSDLIGRLGNAVLGSKSSATSDLKKRVYSMLYDKNAGGIVFGSYDEAKNEYNSKYFISDKYNSSGTVQANYTHYFYGGIACDSPSRFHSTATLDYALCLYNGYTSTRYCWIGRSSETSDTVYIEAQDTISKFRFNKDVEYMYNIEVGGRIYSKNGYILYGQDTAGTTKPVAGISSSNNLFIGASETYGTAGNTHIYGDDYIKFMANRSSDSYKAGTIDILREQISPYRTILRPATNGNAYLGTTSYRWNTAFFTNAITASDLKEKDVIQGFDFKVMDFIMGLDPIAYRRKGDGDTGNRIHIGLGAQTLAKHIKDLGLGDFSMVQASIVENGTERPYDGNEKIDDNQLSWGINYTELIPYTVLMEQNHERRIRYLEEENKQLKQILKENNLLREVA